MKRDDRVVRSNTHGLACVWRQAKEDAAADITAAEEYEQDCRKKLDKLMTEDMMSLAHYREMAKRKAEDARVAAREATVRVRDEARPVLPTHSEHGT